MGWRMEGVATGPALAVACAVLIGLGAGAASARADDPPRGAVDLTPLPEADESLFLIRKLETLLEQLPRDFADGKAAARRIAAVRADLIAGRTSIRARDANKSLDRMYEASLATVDDLVTLLIELGAIDETYYKQQTDYTGTNTVASAAAGYSVGQALVNAGADPVTLGVVVVGYSVYRGISAAMGTKGIDQKRRQARDAKIEAFRRRQTDALTEIRTLAALVGEDKHWKDGEVGFAPADEAEADRVLKAASASDFAYLRTRTDDLLKIRPRDPFLLASFADLTQQYAERWWTADDAKAADLYGEAAAKYERAVRLIPVGRLHNPLRALWLSRAAVCLAKRGYHLGTESDGRPLDLAEAAVGLMPGARADHLAAARTWGLARAGRFDEAIAAHKGSHPDEADRDDAFRYDLACLLSLSGRPEDAAREVEDVVKKGLAPLRLILQDARLARVRPLLTDHYFDVIKVDRTKSTVENVPLCKATKFDYEPGNFWSDLVLKNDNPFPLTSGVVLRSRLPARAQETGALGIAMAVEAADPAASEVLWFDRIAPGKPLRFQGVEVKPIGKEILHDVAFSQENRTLTAGPPLAGEYKGLCTLQKENLSDVLKTTRAALVVAKADAGTPARLTLNPDGATGGAPKREVEFALPELCDGVAYVTTEAGDVVRLYRHDLGVYGWVQSPKERTDGTFTAFILGPAAPN